jgi:Bacterial protein of unknown function (DUF899)
MTDHKVVGREEYEAAREELLEREKEHTRLGDELARQRRELPWVAIEKETLFDADNGTRTLAELFDGRSQLLIYHFMFGPTYEAGCPTCSSMADGFDGLLPHLHARDLTLAFVSRAPLEKLQATSEGWVGTFLGLIGEHRLQLRPRHLIHRGSRCASNWRPSRASRRRPCVTWRPRPGPTSRIHLGITGGQRLRARGRRRLPDLRDHVARGRVPDGLLPDPRPGAEGTRRGRCDPDLDSPPRRVRLRPPPSFAARGGSS